MLKSYFETLVLALHCYCGDNVKYGLISKHLCQRKLQYGGWKNLTNKVKVLQKTMTSSNQMNKKHSSKQHANSRKSFSQWLLLKVYESFFSDRVKYSQCSLVCVNLLCISREKETKQKLFMRNKFNFLYAYFQFDVPKCEFILKYSNLEWWLYFCLFLWLTQKIISCHDFVAL